MTGFKKSSVMNQPSYNSLYVNPLNEIKPSQYNSKESSLNLFLTSDNKENTTPNIKKERFCSKNKENVVIRLGVNNGSSSSSSSSSSSGKEKLLLEEKSDYSSSPYSVGTTIKNTKSLKPSSLQLCMQFNEPDSSFGLNIWDPLEETENENPSKAHVWDFSDSEAAPASSWSTLPNRSLLCRPLPVDIGRCTCVIVKEASLEGLNGGSVYSLYTNEGKGRQDRKLAMAHHRKRNGRSEFTIAQNIKGLLCSSDESFLGTINANFMGSKYHIWDKGNPLDSLKKQSKLLLAVVAFVPTIATCTGSFRALRAWIPKHQSMQLKNTTTQIQHINGLPKDWECKINRAHQLFSRVPQYNKFSKQFELDFRERVKSTGHRIQSSAKNFQLTMEENGRQSILQLGRVGKSQYVMDYRYPLTGYQAFCICLASIDSKLCCMV